MTPLHVIVLAALVVVGKITMSVVIDVVSTLLAAAITERMGSSIERWAVRLLPPEQRERYAEEWADEMSNAAEHALKSTSVALEHLRCVPRLRCQLRRQGTTYGDLVVSFKAQQRGLGAVEVALAMSKGGPKETFLLKPGDKKVIPKIHAGTKGLVTVTRSGGQPIRYFAPATKLRDGTVQVVAARAHFWTPRRKQSHVVITIAPNGQT